MNKELARAVRKNRVSAMAETGASPDAWAEVLLLTSSRHELADLQAWCRRAAEDAENRRLIESAEHWAVSLANLEQASGPAATQHTEPTQAETAPLDAERQWLAAQLVDLPPPDPTPGWTLRATLLDLVQYAQIDPHDAFDPHEWRAELKQILATQSESMRARGNSAMAIEEATQWLRQIIDAPPAGS